MIIAVIDIGTNSVKYLLAGTGNEKSAAVLKDIVKITRLGRGLGRSGEISLPALQETADTVNEFALDAKKNSAEIIRIVGTMALRTASNAEELLNKIKSLTGIDTEILSGEDEAFFSFSGAVSDLKLDNVSEYCTIDIGGGSTELVFVKEEEVVFKVSLKVGALLLTEKIFLREKISEEDLKRADDELDQAFGAVKSPFKAGLAVGIGGNVTSIASVYKKMAKYVPGQIHGTVLSEEEIERQIREYSFKNLAERRKIPGLDPERADIILAGACIVRYAMRFCGCSEMVVSSKGLRHGVLYSVTGRMDHKP